jgi:hypothetical protein
MLYERDMIRAYRDAHACVSGVMPPSYYIDNDALQFVMGDSGLVLDLPQTSRRIYRRCVEWRVLFLQQ